MLVAMSIVGISESRCRPGTLALRPNGASAWISGNAMSLAAWSWCSDGEYGVSNRTFIDTDSSPSLHFVLGDI
jgi:hypothetical protein